MDLFDGFDLLTPRNFLRNVALLSMIVMALFSINICGYDTRVAPRVTCQSISTQRERALLRMP